jgi:oligosaccharide repeat unit polymerase
MWNMINIVYSGLAVIFYWYFYIKTKDKLNPFGVFLFIWYFSATIAILYYSSLQQPWSLEMHLVVLLSGISFFFGSFIFMRPRKLNRQQIKLKCNKTYIYLTRFIFVVALSSFVIELYYYD